MIGYNLKEAFKQLRKIGILAKMNIGGNRVETYRELHKEVSLDESFFGFVGFSRADGLERNKKGAMLPLVWGTSEIMASELKQVRDVIIDILNEHNIVVDVNKCMEVTISDMGIEDTGDWNTIMISEDEAAFKEYMEKYNQTKSKCTPVTSSCRQHRRESQKTHKSSNPSNIIEFVGRPYRNDPINDRDIRYIEHLNSSEIDVDVFIKLT